MVKKVSSKNKSGKNGDSKGVIVDSDVINEMERRFLSYALSTIVSRALPDVRDGLKPVHRRVMYAMSQLKLNPENRFRKSAAVVGDVIGKYHPHGDQAVYDTMVRLAQDFSLRYPLVDGQGNFGNIDGDSAAAMRYTEAKLTKLATELLVEMKKGTVEFVPTYDQLMMEPALLPARFPNLLVNGSSGIAVGLATNIPPHNLTETINALLALIDKPDLELKEVLHYIKGPDFPTGGEIVASKAELMEVYEAGRGSITVQGRWKVEEVAKNKWIIVISSIPYSVNKSKLIEKIAELIINNKMGDLVDVRDESTEIIRIVLEPRVSSVEAEKVMAYLFKHTDLGIKYAVNLTALTPDSSPVRHSLLQMLKSFLTFRFEVTEKRLRYDLAKLDERLYILIALAKIYLDLDTAIKIIRKAKTRDEARQGLITQFSIDDTQANAILDLRLSALVGLEISKIELEKAEKEAEREEIAKVLAEDSKIWRLIRKELTSIKDEYGDARRTKVVGSAKNLPEYDAESYIRHEDTHVIVSRSGWMRRMKSVGSLDTLRFKEGDSRLAWLPINTKDIVIFFTSTGRFYGMKALDIVQTTGFGLPVQSIFKFDDGERLVSVVAVITQGDNTNEEKGGTQQANLFDKLAKKEVSRVCGETVAQGSGADILVTLERGNGFRISADMLTVTAKNGKKVANVRGEDSTFSVNVISNKTLVFLLTTEGNGILLELNDIPKLNGAGGGVRLIKLKPPATLLGAKVVNRSDSVTLTYYAGNDDVIKVSKIEPSNRAGAGRKISSTRKKLLGMLKSS